MPLNLQERFYRLLRWSERYIKTDMVYFATGGFWLTLAQGVSILTGFVVLVAFANLLPKDTLGTYRYLLAVMAILAIPTLDGIGTAVLQATARGYEGTFGAGVRTKLSWGLLSTAASWGLAIYYWTGHNLLLAGAFGIIGLSIPPLYAFSVYDSFLLGKKLFSVSSLWNSLNQVGYVVCIVVCLLITKNLLVLITVYCAVWMLFRYICLRATKRTYVTNRSEEPSAVAYGKHLSAIGVIMTFASYVDQVLIFHFLGPVAVASYSVALAPVSQMSGLSKNIKSLMLPKFSNKDAADIKEGYWQKLLLFFLFLAVAVSAYILVAPFLFKIFFPQYLGAVLYSQILALSFLGDVAIVNGGVLQARKRQRELYVLTTLGAVVKVTLMLLGVLFQGILGLIVGFVIGELLSGLYSTWQVYRLEEGVVAPATISVK